MAGLFQHGFGSGLFDSTLGQVIPDLARVQRDNVGGGSNFPPASPAAHVAAIGRDAPVADAPVTLLNPFNFPRLFGDLQNRYLWNKLIFDPKPLPANPFFLGTYDDMSGLYAPAPMNPPEGVPILEPRFR